MQNTPPRRRSRRVYPFPATLSVAIVLATLFTCLPTSGLFSSNLVERMSLLLTAQPETSPQPETTPFPQLRIGIVAGHWGNDSGAVCPNGTTEQEVNLKIATLVQQQLTDYGFQVDLLQEFDPRLDGYRAVALVSIHNDSCDFINEEATGFKVAAALSSHDQNRAARLTACLIDRYGGVTGLPFHSTSITRDMTDYHAFDEIDTSTVAAIIETGFLNLDRELLTRHPELVARGIADGILCYLKREPITYPTNTPVTNYAPTATSPTP